MDVVSATPRRARISRSAPAAIAVTVALIAPLIVGATTAIVAAAQSPLESSAEIAPLIGAVEFAERSAEVQVAVAVDFAPALVAVTVASGTVTAVGFARGDEVVTGTRLVAIDDRDVIAYTAAAPLYRDLTRGATGRDVSTAQGLLDALGFNPGVINGTVGSATTAAIVAFNKQHGYGSRNAVLSLASLSWVGTGTATVADVRAVLGTTAGPGTELFAGVALAVAITVSEPAGIAADEPLQLAVGDVSAAYEQGSGRITDPEAVAEMAAAIGTAGDGIGTLRRTEPLVVGTVPSASVVADRSGATCIFADDVGGPIVIEPRGGSVGTVDIDASFVGRSVVLNPRDVRDDLSCVVP